MPLPVSVSSVMTRSPVRGDFQSRIPEKPYQLRSSSTVHQINSQTMNTPAKQSIDVLVKRRVLLVEDEVVQQEMLSKALECGGFEVVIANDGRQALDMMKSQDFPLIITDWEMPNLDGLDLCRAIRNAKS